MRMIFVVVDLFSSLLTIFGPGKSEEHALKSKDMFIWIVMQALVILQTVLNKTYRKCTKAKQVFVILKF